MKLNLLLTLFSILISTTIHAGDDSSVHNKRVIISKYGSSTYVIGSADGFGTIVRNKKGSDTNIIKIIPGLSDKNLISFELTSLPGHYLRHQNSKLKWHNTKAAGPLKADATFMMVKGLTGKGTVSFRSVNYPSRYIAFDQNKELWIREMPDKKAASFKLNFQDI